MLIPNIFTLVGLCAGLTAIRMGIEHRWDLAVAALVFAAFLDGIDGHVARLLKASSRFGAELDSLADFVNFGVAPAIIMFNWALEDLQQPRLDRRAGLRGVLGAQAGALQCLAGPRPTLPAWKSNYFVGVPAPAGAIILLLPIYAQDLGLHLPSLTPLVLFYTLGMALLMVSKVPTFSIKLIGQKIAREHVLPVFVLAALFMALLLDLSLAHAGGGLVDLSRADPAFRLSLLSLEEREEAKAAKAQSGKGQRRPAEPSRAVSDWEAGESSGA